MTINHLTKVGMETIKREISPFSFCISIPRKNESKNFLTTLCL